MARSCPICTRRSSIKHYICYKSIPLPKWKAGAYPPPTGCSTCKSSLQEAISVHLHLPTTKFGGMCSWSLFQGLHPPRHHLSTPLRCSHDTTGYGDSSIYGTVVTLISTMLSVQQRHSCASFRARNCRSVSFAAYTLTSGGRAALARRLAGHDVARRSLRLSGRTMPRLVRFERRSVLWRGRRVFCAGRPGGKGASFRCDLVATSAWSVKTHYDEDTVSASSLLRGF